MDRASKETLRPFLKIGVSIIAALSILFSLTFLWLKVENVERYRVNGDSMFPTMRNGQTVFIRETEQISKGDIIVFKYPSSWKKFKNTPEKDFTVIKRVSAVEGEKLTVKSGKLYNNDGEAIANLSEHCPGVESEGSIIVPDGKIFATGDNRKGSFDSSDILCEDSESAFISEDSIEHHGQLVFSV